MGLCELIYVPVIKSCLFCVTWCNLPKFRSDKGSFLICKINALFSIIFCLIFTLCHWIVPFSSSGIHIMMLKLLYFSFRRAICNINAQLKRFFFFTYMRFSMLFPVDSAYLCASFFYFAEKSVLFLHSRVVIFKYGEGERERESKCLFPWYGSWRLLENRRISNRFLKSKYVGIASADRSQTGLTVGWIFPVVEI